MVWLQVFEALPKQWKFSVQTLHQYELKLIIPCVFCDFSLLGMRSCLSLLLRGHLCIRATICCLEFIVICRTVEAVDTPACCRITVMKRLLLFLNQFIIISLPKKRKIPTNPETSNQSKTIIRLSWVHDLGSVGLVVKNEHSMVSIQTDQSCDYNAHPLLLDLKL